jgi:hypothetical protein
MVWLVGAFHICSILHLPTKQTQKCNDIVHHVTINTIKDLKRDKYYFTQIHKYRVWLSCLLTPCSSHRVKHFRETCCLHLQGWRVSQHVPLKCWAVSELQSDTIQKIALFIAIAVKTSNPTDSKILQKTLLLILSL